MLAWPFKGSSTLIVQGWGFWLAIVGMLISIIGFWITLVQLARTKKATSAVSNEIRRIKFAVSKYDATVEASKAEGALDSAVKFFRSDDWFQAGEAIESLSKSIHTLKELNVPELSSKLDDISGVMSHSDKLCERLDKAKITGLPDTEKGKALSVMREHGRLLTSIRIALQRSSISE